MKYKFSASPNLRQSQSTKQIMLELMIGLLVVFAFSLYYYNSAYGMSYVLQAVKLLCVSLLVVFVTEIAFAYVTRKKNKFDVAYVKTFLSGSFGWITAIILTMMCPISIRPYALAVSTFIAIFFGKLVFGGFGNNIFNPAALGRAIIFATFMGATTDVITGATPTGLIANEYHWLVVNPEMITQMMGEVGGLKTLFTGMYPGAIGETSALLILIVGIVLAYRKVIDWRIPVVYLGSIFVLTAAIAIMRGVGNYGSLPGFIWYPLVHVLTGGVIFGAIFMLTDPVTSPTSAQGRCIFALGAAIITVLIRIKANLPEGCLYSILIMNMLTPMIESAVAGKQLQSRRKAGIIFGIVALLGLGSVLLAGNVIEAREPDPKVFIKAEDEDVNKFEASITSKETNADGNLVYVVDAQGFHALEDPKELNTFTITVNAADQTIVSVEATKIVDTEYVGDKVKDADFLSQFNGKKLAENVEVEINDAVTGATYSSKSCLRAVAEVRKDLGY